MSELDRKDHPGSDLSTRPTATARIAQPRTGDTVALDEHLRFQLDHAAARDAVHAALDTAFLERGLQTRGVTTLRVQSAARTRTEYLRRPDLGRTLDAASEALLRAQPNLTNPPIAILLADGLSALALERHALPLLDALQKTLGPWPLTLGPILIATQARVALGDPIGAALHARATLVLIGERPGLSSPDSLGAYLTWAPRPGRTDAERNCISNIRAEGLSYTEAATRIAWYLRAAERLGTTGTALKDPDTTTRTLSS